LDLLIAVSLGHVEDFLEDFDVEVIGKREERDSKFAINLLSLV